MFGDTAFEATGYADIQHRVGGVGHEVDVAFCFHIGRLRPPIRSGVTGGDGTPDQVGGDGG